MLQSVKPVKPAAPYVGGKRQLAKRIVSKINEVHHKSYVEPFCGMGGVFFRRTHKPVCEVINDLSGEVTNFFRVLQRHFEPLRDMFRYSITSRAEFDRLKNLDPSVLTDLERAHRFIVLLKTGLGGNVLNPAFGVRKGMVSRFNSPKLDPMLEALYERLSGVVIEQLNFDECIRRYDAPDTLFYIDPPYWGSEGYYGEGLYNKEDFEKLATQLKSINGRFILSINDTPEIRKLFGDFTIEDADLVYTFTAGAAQHTSELIVSNS